MGDLGSGRRMGLGRELVDDCRSIDVNRLRRAGYLRLSQSRRWQWTRNGEEVAWISLHAVRDQLHLSYRVHVGTDRWEERAGDHPDCFPWG